MKSEPSAGADRLALMETFVRIVESGSLSAAAIQLGHTQPTISRRLQALERQLGVRLIHRSTHALTLTDDGARCYERATALIADWQILESEMRGASESPAGLLRVFAPHVFGQKQLIAPLANFLESYPAMRVEWLLNDRIPDFVAENIDCALHVGEVHEPGVVAIPVGKVCRIVVSAPSVLGNAPIPKTPEALARLPWLALQTFYREEAVLRHADSGDIHRVSIQPRLLTDSLHALINAALTGLGVAIVSAWVVREELASGRLLHLTPDWLAEPLPIYIVYPPARFYPARLRRFIDIMREAMNQPY